MSYEVNALKSLLKLNTDATSKLNYREAAELIASMLEELGVDAEIIGKRVPNVVAKLDAGCDKDIAVVSHYDVVPAEGSWHVNGLEVDPFKPVEVDGRIYGRGAADNKSGIAATLGAIRELKEVELRYNPVVIVVGDEEVGGIGMREVLSLGYKFDGAVILDALADYVEIGASGVVHGWIRVYGKGGHAGYPHLCENPIWGLAELITELRRFSAKRASKPSDVPAPPGSPVPYVWGRFSITMLKAGSKQNVIPDIAEAAFDLRIIPGENLDEVIEELVSYFNYARVKHGLRGEIQIDYEMINTGWLTDRNHQLVSEACSAARAAYRAVYGEGGDKVFRGIAAGLGADDGYCFSNKGIPTVGFGAIRRENNIHGANEFVYVKDIILVKEFLKILFKSM